MRIIETVTFGELVRNCVSVPLWLNLCETICGEVGINYILAGEQWV